MTTYAKELELALAVCKQAGRLQLDRRSSLKMVDIKDDRSPVSEVDSACERLIIDAIARRFPSDGVLGEETGGRTGSSGRRWIIDPLDGTRPYLRGIPTYSVLLALEDGHEPVLGVMNLPEMGIACYASQGGGAYWNGKPARVSATATLGAAMGSALGFVERQREDDGARLLKLMGQWDYTYGYMDAYTQFAVAGGKLDLCVSLLDKPWDCAAAACIVAEAGGAYSDVHGARTVHNGSIILSNGYLHEQALEYFSASGERAGKQPGSPPQHG